MKLFRDPVHGNIHIERWVCDDFIDTSVFQRLRFIEQSSVRLLFPGARHDRFIHSIGVFHIAKKIFSRVRGFFEAAGLAPCEVDAMGKCYLIAALLHDCAHSPFSHTGEELAKTYCNQEIEDRLLQEVGGESFRKDMRRDSGRHRLHTHEMASAFVGSKAYNSQFLKYGIDKEQFARMITGIMNDQGNADKVKRAYNCLIQLLNGFIIDADRLDYLIRDTWATGVSNASVDIDRLIAGITLDVENGWVKIHARALSSIINAISARDYIYTWILPHHKVALANLLLSNAMKSLVDRLSRIEAEQHPNDSNINEAFVGAQLFSPERLLLDDSTYIADESVSLPTDGDLLYLMKKYIPDNPFVKAYTSREKVLVSLWKTYAEFSQIFSSQESDNQLLQNEDFWQLLESKIHSVESEGEFVATNVMKIKQTSDDLLNVDVFGPSVCRDGSPMRYELTRLIPRDGTKKFYFYAYAWKEKCLEVGRIRDRLRKLFVDTLEEYRHLG